jgi:hydroxyacylglutathione hydrolase
VEYSVLTVTPLLQNCSLVWCPTTRKAVVIDPGGEAARVLALVQDSGVELERILLTHAHIDHVGAAGALSALTGVGICGPGLEDAFLVESLEQQSQLFGVPLEQVFVPDFWLSAGECLEVGEVKLEVLACPGHTPGHVVYHCAAAGVVFTGDVLFQGSIGRTDFPGGDHDALLGSIREQLWPLGDDVVFVPGHGPEGTLGKERRTNPFLRLQD